MENEKTNTKRFVIIGLIVAVILAFVITIVVFSNQTTANPRQVVLNNSIRLTVEKDEILYNAEHDQDDLYIYMVAENIGEIPEPLDLDNTTGYDASTPTTDQLTEEDIQDLDYYETEKINEKTFNNFQQEVHRSDVVADEALVQAFQDKEILDEPINIERPYPSIPTNEDALSILISPGESIDFCLVYALNSTSEVTLRFVQSTKEGDDSTGGIVEIHFTIAGHSSPQIQARIDEFNKQISQQQSAEYVDWTAATIGLINGWYVDDQQKVNIRLKNPKYNNATINISYNSSGTAAEEAKGVPQWNENGSKEETIIIGDKEYYYILRDNDNFVLVTTGRDDYPVKITVRGVTLGDVIDLIKLIQY